MSKETLDDTKVITSRYKYLHTNWHLAKLFLCWITLPLKAYVFAERESNLLLNFVSFQAKFSKIYLNIILMEGIKDKTFTDNQG